MKPGATIFVHSKGFLPFNIRVHMAKWRHVLRLGGRKTDRRALRYNHTEKVVAISLDTWDKYMREKWGEPVYIDELILVSVSAHAEGAAMTPLLKYLADHPDHFIKVPKVPLSQQDIEDSEKYAIHICFFAHREYQKVMFLQWMLRIASLGWYDERTSNDNRVYCFEVVREFDELTLLYPLQDGLVDIFDLWENPKFEDYKEKPLKIKT